MRSKAQRTTELHMTRSIPLLILAGMVAEIASIIWVGRALGVIATLALLFAGGVIGIRLMKSAGTTVAAALRSPVQTSSAIGGAGSLAVTRVLAGLLFLIPGFFSDFFAVLVLLPPVRQWLQSRFRVETAYTGRTGEAQPFRERHYATVIDGEAIEITAEVEAPPASGQQRS